MPPGRHPSEVFTLQDQLGGDPGGEPEPAGGIIYHLAWKRLRTPQEDLETVAGERNVWKMMDGWMDEKQSTGI